MSSILKQMAWKAIWFPSQRPSWHLLYWTQSSSKNRTTCLRCRRISSLEEDVRNNRTRSLRNSIGGACAESQSCTGANGPSLSGSGGGEAVKDEGMKIVGGTSLDTLSGSVVEVKKEAVDVSSDRGKDERMVKGVRQHMVTSSGNKSTSMRWIVGKVKGRLKVDYLEAEIKPQVLQRKPWTFVVNRNKGTYQEFAGKSHNASPKNYTSKLFKVKNLTSTNFVHDKYDTCTYREPTPALAQASVDEGGLVPISGSISAVKGTPVNYLSREVGMTISDTMWYINSAPSLLGVSMEKLGEEVEEMRKVGFKNVEIARILPSFSSCLEMDWENMHGIFKVLTEDLELEWTSVVTLMRKYPYIFTKDCSKVRRLRGHKGEEWGGRV